MKKHIFSIIYNLIQEMKDYDKYENTEKICAVLNNEISSVRCHSVTVNHSPQTSSFYGVIVFPALKFTHGEFSVNDYTIEIQQQALDVLSAKELAALIIHDISHNILSSTVYERLKLAIIKACRLTHMKIAEVFYNMDNKMKNLAILDISNRTYKSKIVPGTDMYEPDRLLVDMEITEHFNSAIDTMDSIDYLNLSKPDDQDIGDTFIGTKIIKMVKERLRGLDVTYKQLYNYMVIQYGTKVFYNVPGVHDVKIVDKEDYELDVIFDKETLSPFELQHLQETTVQGMMQHSGSDSAKLVLESTFGAGKISYSKLQKELDILNFKIESIGSNYERLAVLDRIYDNIFALEKYLEKNPDEKMVWDFLRKFMALTGTIKDAKVSKRQYGVFVEVPAGFEG